MKVENCCICIKIETGVAILGVLTLLGIFEEIKQFYLFKAITLAALIISFGVMYFKNQTETRMATFFLYVFKSICDSLLFFFWLKPEQGGYSVATWAKHACEGMTADDLATFTEEHGECNPAMEKYIFYVTGVMFTLGAFLQIHFILVLYTYWQQAAEKGEAGSPGEDEEPMLGGDDN